MGNLKERMKEKDSEIKSRRQLGDIIFLKDKDVR